MVYEYVYTSVLKAFKLREIARGKAIGLLYISEFLNYTKTLGWQPINYIWSYLKKALSEIIINTMILQSYINVNYRRNKQAETDLNRARYRGTGYWTDRHVACYPTHYLAFHDSRVWFGIRSWAIAKVSLANIGWPCNSSLGLFPQFSYLDATAWNIQANVLNSKCVCQVFKENVTSS